MPQSPGQKAINSAPSDVLAFVKERNRGVKFHEMWTQARALSDKFGTDPFPNSDRRETPRISIDSPDYMKRITIWLGTSTPSESHDSVIRGFSVMLQVQTRSDTGEAFTSAGTEFPMFSYGKREGDNNGKHTPKKMIKGHKRILDFLEKEYENPRYRYWEMNPQ